MREPVSTLEATELSPGRDGTATPPIDPALLRSDSIARRAAQYVHQDRGLWLLVVVVFVVVTAGFVAAVLPRALSGTPRAGNHLPLLVLGFITLVSLLNVYIGRQRRSLRQVQNALLQEFLRAEVTLARSFVDPLTQLFNRQYMDHLLNVETKRAQRAGSHFTMAVLDVDDFKGINDRFGHVEGDRLLYDVGSVLRGVFRQTDTVIRFGGDEFLVVMPDTSVKNGHKAMARLQAAIGDWNAQHAGARGYSLSMSWGIASHAPDASLEDTLNLADQRMYAAKAARLASRTAGTPPAEAAARP